MRVCVDFNNVLWLCEDCLSSFRKQRSAPTNQKIAKGLVDKTPEINVEHTVYQLQSEFANIKQSFAELKRTIACDQNSDSVTPCNASLVPNETRKTPRVVMQFCLHSRNLQILQHRKQHKTQHELRERKGVHQPGLKPISHANLAFSNLGKISRGEGWETSAFRKFTSEKGVIYRNVCKLSKTEYLI